MRVTGVGSLPHADADEAAAFVLATTDVPFLPQLPNRHPEERMLVQWGDGLCGCGATDGGVGLGYQLSPGPRAEAFGGAEATLARLGGDVATVKTQATGPVTLGMGLLAAGHPRRDLWECLTAELAERIVAHLDAVAAVLPAAEVLLVLDEPALVGLLEPGFPITPTEAEAALRTTLELLPAGAGIHCCGETDWGMVADLGPTAISWDVRALGPTFERSAEHLGRAVAEGTRVIWGITPATLWPVDAVDLARRVRAAMGHLVVGGADFDRLYTESLVSPSCGLAALTVDQAEVVMERVRGVTAELAPDG